jgi:hypothetical protein
MFFYSSVAPKKMATARNTIIRQSGSGLAIE